MDTNVESQTEATPDPALPSRLRAAREDAGLSRAALARRTGIPAKAIEKFEFGAQEPSVSRLRAICNALGIPLGVMLGEDDVEGGRQTPDPPAINPLRRDPAGHDELDEDEPDLAPATAVLSDLETLDDLRADDFEGRRRQAMAMVGDVLAKLRRLEPGELVRVADERGVYPGECPSTNFLADLFGENPGEGQKHCGLVEERIVDTAILGVDLYAIDQESLAALADRLDDDGYELEERGGSFLFGSWENHAELVPVIRPVLRSLAFAGNGEDFSDREAYPRRR